MLFYFLFSPFSNHLQAFTGWMAQTLSARQMTVTDLRTDLEDGIALINFFELLTRSTLKDKYDRSPKSRIQKIQNCHLALKFLERETGINTSQAGYCAEGTFFLACFCLIIITTRHCGC